MSVELAESSPIAPPAKNCTSAPASPSRRSRSRPSRSRTTGPGRRPWAPWDSPQAAVEELIEAVVAQDAIGVGETLAPSERDLVLEHLDPILDELQRLDVASDDADTRDVAGREFTADIDSLRLQESPLSDSVTRVRILDGDLGFDADFGAVPLGSVVSDNVEGPLKDPDPVDLLVDVFGGQADVVVVKGSDGWHVSVFYTLAEYVRADVGLPSAGLGGGPTPVGAESPDALIGAVIDGVVAGDFATLLTLADPVEGAVLYDYWSIFEPYWAESMAGVLADGPWADVRSYETTVAGEGSERVVSLTGWDYAYTFGRTNDEGPLSSFDGECFVTTYGIVSDGGEGFLPQVEGCRGGAVEIDGEVVTPLRSGLSEISVVERDGRWYVRPGATLIESWRANTALIEATELLSPIGLLLRAYPSLPTWGYGVDQLSLGMTISEESGESMESSPTALGLPCAEHTDADALATCFSEFYGAQVTAEDVAGCETQSEGLAESDEITRFDELESCLLEVMFPRRPGISSSRNWPPAPGVPPPTQPRRRPRSSRHSSSAPAASSRATTSPTRSSRAWQRAWVSTPMRWRRSPTTTR